MNYSGQHTAVQRYAMQHSIDYLREALQLWLVAGEKINYSAQDNNILTAIGFKPDAVPRDDSREKFMPAQNLTYTLRRAEQPCSIPFKNSRKTRCFLVKKPCMHKVHGFACVLTTPNPRQHWRALRPVMHLH